MNDSTDPAHDPQRSWESGWEDHELQQLQRLAKLSFPEKLAWLEEAHRLVRKMQARTAQTDQSDSREGK